MCTFNRFPRDLDRTSYITPRRLPAHTMCVRQEAAITESSLPHKYRPAGNAEFHQHTFTTSHAPSHLICSLFRRRRRRPRRSSRSTYSGASSIPSTSAAVLPFKPPDALDPEQVSEQNKKAENLVFYLFQRELGYKVIKAQNDTISAWNRREP